MNENTFGGSIPNFDNYHFRNHIIEEEEEQMNQPMYYNQQSSNLMDDQMDT